MSQDRRDDSRERGPPSGGSVGSHGNEPTPTTSLLVRNISYRVRAQEIRRVFSQYGEVRDVYIPQVRYIFK